jgi:transcriptional regulator GlxA family with amidase domain
MANTSTCLGVVIFPGFALLDVAGPLEFFNQFSRIQPFELCIIAKTMDPVSTLPPDHVQHQTPYQQISQSWLPTHTFDSTPKIDILMIPGGFGTRNETIFDDVTRFIKEQYPKVKYLLSICTGSAMVSATGILDGRKATSNKTAWPFATRRKDVLWMPKARWVVDGNIWTSSGVAAGMDMTFAFIAAEYSLEVARKLANNMEYEPHTDPDWDPFSIHC